MKKVKRELIDPFLYETIYSCLQSVYFLANLLPLSDGSKRLEAVSLHGAEALHTFFESGIFLDGSVFEKDLQRYVASANIQYHNKE